MIRDYPCTYLQSNGQALSVYEGHSFPEVHLKAEDMAVLALEIREKTGAEWCILPFCHTVEAEALGAKIRYGDARNGPRVAQYACQSIEELCMLPPIDPAVGRMAQVLKACRLLRERGEEVLLEITGPFTLLSSLIEPAIIFRALRKAPEYMNELLNKLQSDLLLYIECAQTAGVHLFSYADPTGGVNILGPKLTEQLTKDFTMPLLKEMDLRLDSDVLIHLCPKTVFALQDTGMAEACTYDLSGDFSYTEAILSACGKVRFVGQTCLKNQKFRPGPVLQGLRLK